MEKLQMTSVGKYGKGAILTIVLVALSGLCPLLSQEVKINNNLVVESDGTLRYDNTATMWADLSVFPDATSRGGSNQPTWTKFIGNGASQGVFLWMFDPLIEQEVYFTVQIPHNYKEGTVLKPHIHWTTSTGTPTRTNVVWGLEYTFMKVGGTFGATTTLTTNTIIPFISTISGTSQHLISSFNDITSGTSPNNIEISTILVCRLFRKATDAADTFAYPTALLSFDFHYEMDTQGSRTDYSK